MNFEVNIFEERLIIDILPSKQGSVGI